jgi:hypothetical protein
LTQPTLLEIRIFQQPLTQERYNSCDMRIVSVRPAPVARVFSLCYAACGLAAFLQYALSDAQTFILPIGILMGVFHLNINIHLSRSTDLLANSFLGIGAILTYALSGWITGIATSLGFNFVAQKTGGIDAKFAAIDEDASVRPSQVPVG